MFVNSSIDVLWSIVTPKSIWDCACVPTSHLPSPYSTHRYVPDDIFNTPSEASLLPCSTSFQQGVRSQSFPYFIKCSGLWFASIYICVPIVSTANTCIHLSSIFIISTWIKFRFIRLNEAFKAFRLDPTCLRTRMWRRVGTMMVSINLRADPAHRCCCSSTIYTRPRDALGL